MDKRWRTIVCLFSAIFILLIAYILPGIYEQRFVSRVTIDFELPLPDTIAEKYNIPINPEVEKVIIAGFFSDWNPSDKNYLMKKIPDSNGKIKWTYELVLPPGDHQYKFVVYLKNKSEPVWTQDNDSYKDVFNGLGSYNSILSIRSYEKIRGVLLSVIYILLIFTSISLLYLLSSRSGVNNAPSVIIIFVVICNILFAGFYLNNNRSNHILISKSIISILNNELGNYFSKKTDYIAESKNIFNIYNYFLWYKLDKMGIKDLSKRFKYASLIFFDNNFNIVSYDYRYFSGHEKKDRISDEMIKSILTGYFENHIKNVKGKNIDAVNYKIPSYQQLFTATHFIRNSKNFRTSNHDFSFNIDTFFYPCVVNNEIQGYYGVLFSGEPIRVLNNFIIANIVFLFVIVGLLFLLSFIKKEKELDDFEKLDCVFERFNITAREKDIIICLLKGESNKTIAYSLNISKKTVDNHIYNIFHKTGANNRIELINLIRGN